MLKFRKHFKEICREIKHITEILKNKNKKTCDFGKVLEKNLWEKKRPRKLIEECWKIS